MLPSTLAMILAGPAIAGGSRRAVGSRVPLSSGVAYRASRSCCWPSRTPHWQVYLAAACSGRHRPRVRVDGEPDRRGGAPDQTGVATGMNTIVRTIGGALGRQVVVSVITSGVAVGALPHESGYVLSFLVMAVGLTAAGLAAVLVPSAVRRAGLAPVSADAAEPLAERV